MIFNEISYIDAGLVHAGGIVIRNRRLMGHIQLKTMNGSRVPA